MERRNQPHPEPDQNKPAHRAGKPTLRIVHPETSQQTDTLVPEVDFSKLTDEPERQISIEQTPKESKKNTKTPKPKYNSPQPFSEELWNKVLKHFPKKNS